MKAALALIALAAGLSDVRADCVPAETGGSLGTVSSFRVRQGPVIGTSANFTLTCGGIVLSALGTPTLRTKIVSGTTNLTLKNGVHQIPYQLTDMGGASYTQGLLIINASGLAVLGLLSNNAATLPVRITTAAGANVPAGTYTDTITVNWEYANICEGLLGLGNLCLGVPRNGNVNRPLTVQLVVTNDCAITAPDIHFGSAPLPGAFSSVTQNLTLTCTRGLLYTVGITAGGRPSAGRRRMLSAEGNLLAYDVFKPGGGVWGTDAANRVPGVGVADGITAQTLPYTATIYPDQPAVPPGLYQDSVQVEVQF